MRVMTSNRDNSASIRLRYFVACPSGDEISNYHTDWRQHETV